LSYSEGSTHYRFPIYEEDGRVVFVAWPTTQRTFLLLHNWTRAPREFPDADRHRITARIVDHFRRQGLRVRVVTREEDEEQGLQFHPELFECKGLATEILDAAGFSWLSEYGSIDLLHEEFGLEVCGINEEASVQPIVNVLCSAFPHWHYHHVCQKDY